MVDPRDLLVYVVGIERYDGGLGWDLDGPASDALDFAEWLVDRGVPPQNIQAFLAPLQHLGDPLASRPLLRGKIKRRGATAAEIYTALTDEISAAKPGHFCLFWGGHGCIMANGDRYLFGSESTATHLQCIDLTGFFRYLATDALGPYPGRGSRQFITIVDACGTFADERGFDRCDHLATAHPFPRREQVRRSQCAVFATNPGEVAVNLSEKTGLFSRELRNQLQQSTSSTPDVFQQLEAAVLRLQDTFKIRAQNQEGSQHPYFYSVQPFDQDEQVLGHPRLEQIDRHFARYVISYTESRDLQVLANEIGTYISEADVRRMFRIAVDGSKSGPASCDGPASFSDCTLLLAKGFPGPLFTFLAQCRPSLAKKKLAAAAFDRWQQNVALRLGLDLKSWHAKARKAGAKADTKVKPQVIQLIVDPVFGPPGGEQYQMRAAISDADATDSAEVTIVVNSNAVPATQLPDVLRTVCQEVFSDLTTYNGLRIEAVLPAELMSAGAQDWIVRVGANDFHLSEKFPLALRSHERQYLRDYSIPLALQKDKWRRLRKRLTAVNVTWCDDPARLDGAALECWEDSRTLALFALQFSRNDAKRQGHAIEKLIAAGIPLGVWFHDPQQPANGWRESLEKNFMAQPCKDWPTQARDFHKKTPRSPACTGLVLLWDNPEQPLPQLPGRHRTPLQTPNSGSRS